MGTKDWWYLIATVASPFLAAGITSLLTLFWQHRNEKRNAKLRVFTALMAHRKSSPFPPDAVNAFNLIDVVFDDNKGIVDLWHELYTLFHNSQATQAQHHKYIDLLSAMAKELGFRNIQQTDIDKFYTPQGQVDQASLINETQAELLRVLKNTNRLVLEPRLADPKIISVETPQETRQPLATSAEESRGLPARLRSPEP